MNSWRYVLGDGSAQSVEDGHVIPDRPDFIYFENIGQIYGLLFDAGKFYVKHHTASFDEAWIKAFVIDGREIKYIWEKEDPAVEDYDSNIFLTEKYIYRNMLILDKETGNTVFDISDKYEQDFVFQFMYGDEYYRQVKYEDAALGFNKFNVNTGLHTQAPIGIASLPVQYSDKVVGFGSRGIVAYGLDNDSLCWEYPLIDYCEKLDLAEFAIKDEFVVVITEDWLLKINLLNGECLSSVKYIEIPELIDAMEKHTRSSHFSANYIAFDGRFIVLIKLNVWGYVLCLSADDLRPIWCLPSRDIGYTCIAGDYIFTTDDGKHKCLKLDTGQCLVESKKASDSNMVMASDDYIVFYQYPGNAEFYKFKK